MTVRYRGGGHKRKYRIIDFKREKDGVPARVKTIEYDPNRSARIALLFYADGEKRYIIAPIGLKVGDVLNSGPDAAPEVGNALPLANIPVGTVIHNIELRPGQGAKLVRAAGNFAQLTSRDGSYCVIKLPSGEQRKILSACKATVGSVGNSDHALEQSGKAGRSRWLGRRPHNRGVVMNPHDHPMGGGEGRQSGGHPRSRNGLYAKGLKTRAPKKHSNKYIIERANKTPDAVRHGVAAVRNGMPVVTDTNMAKAGVSRAGLGKFGGEVFCFMADPLIAEQAKAEGCTRAAAAMRHAAGLYPQAIYAVGNAPTALLALEDQIRQGLRPSLIIGAPVGFVNVVESKERILQICREYEIPAIVAAGRKGGSSIAAAICNALIYTAADMLDPAERGWN